MKLPKKDLQIFWGAIILGVFGGILGNLFTSLWVELLINTTSKIQGGEKVLWVAFGVIFILLIRFIFWIMKKIKDVDNITRGRPKKKK